MMDSKTFKILNSVNMQPNKSKGSNIVNNFENSLFAILYRVFLLDFTK